MNQFNRFIHKICMLQKGMFHTWINSLASADDAICICHHWFKKWLGAVSRLAISWINADSIF